MSFVTITVALLWIMPVVMAVVGFCITISVVWDLVIYFYDKKMGNPQRVFFS